MSGSGHPVIEGTRPTTAELWSVAAMLVGVVSVAAGAWSADTAADGLLSASAATVARIRELDAIARPDGTGGADPLALVEEDLRRAGDPAEAAALARARDCLVAATGCEGGLEGALEPASAYYADRLAASWKVSEARRRLARWIMAAGTALALVGAAGVVLSRRARPRPADQAAPGPAPAAPSSSGIEQMLRRRLEELYETRLRAWQTDRFAAYGEIAAGLSHGLKTPLASIRAATQLLELRLGPDHPVAPQVQDILEETDSLVEQVRRFLQAAGTGAPVPALIPPGRLVEVLDRDYAPAARRHGVHWLARTEEGLGEICVDPALIEMACRNLVENALAAAPAGTTVELVARRAGAPERAGLDEEAPPPGPWVEIAVRDEGEGIASAVLAGREGRSTKPNGNGLGIAITRRIVARHGGAVAFEVGKGGTTARVLLPVANAAAEVAG